MTIVNGAPYLPQIRELIIAYTDSLQRDLTFQNLRGELDDLAARYTPPHGDILAALDDGGQVVGCVAYHRHSDRRCEMKRLYVLPACRGQHVGEQLVAGIIDLARRAGYTEMVLDTLAPMKAAQALYRRAGFREISPYYDNPMEDVTYLALDLRAE